MVYISRGSRVVASLLLFAVNKIKKGGGREDWPRVLGNHQAAVAIQQQKTRVIFISSLVALSLFN